MQQVEPGFAPEDDDDFIAIVQQEVIAYKVKSQGANALVTAPEIVKEAAEQLFRAVILGAQQGIRIVVYDGVIHVIFD